LKRTLAKHAKFAKEEWGIILVLLCSSSPRSPRLREIHILFPREGLLSQTDGGKEKMLAETRRTQREEAEGELTDEINPDR
jgi:hypothetical protein